MSELYNEGDHDGIIEQMKREKNKLQSMIKNDVQIGPEDVNQFIIDKASSMAEDCVEIIHSLKGDIQLGADSKIIDSASAFVNAFNGTLGILTRLQLSNDKIKAQREIESMKIEMKVDKADDKPKGLYASREEVMKEFQELIKSKEHVDMKVSSIEADVIDVNQLTDP